MSALCISRAATARPAGACCLCVVCRWAPEGEVSLLTSFPCPSVTFGMPRGQACRRVLSVSGVHKGSWRVPLVMPRWHSVCCAMAEALTWPPAVQLRMLAALQMHQNR
jgi:hypothetical protein